MENQDRNEIIKVQLISLHESYGKLTPPIVVQAATPEDHPLHKYFEWDNEKAGYSYRLFQARQIIRSVTIPSKITNGMPERHVFIHTRNEKDLPVYHLTDLIMKEPNLLEMALGEAKGRLCTAVLSLKELEKIAEEAKAPKKQIKKYQKASELSQRAQKELLPIKS